MPGQPGKGKGVVKARHQALCRAPSEYSQGEPAILPQRVEMWLQPDHGGSWEGEREAKHQIQEPKLDPSFLVRNLCPSILCLQQSHFPNSPAQIAVPQTYWPTNYPSGEDDVWRRTLSTSATKAPPLSPSPLSARRGPHSWPPLHWAMVRCR